MCEETDGETTQLPNVEHDPHDEVPSLAEQRATGRKARGLARDLQRPVRKAGAA